mgnify:CR=1 FL=1
MAKTKEAKGLISKMPEAFSKDIGQVLAASGLVVIVAFFSIMKPVFRKIGRAHV